MDRDCDLLRRRKNDINEQYFNQRENSKNKGKYFVNSSRGVFGQYRNIKENENIEKMKKSKILKNNFEFQLKSHTISKIIKSNNKAEVRRIKHRRFERRSNSMASNKISQNKKSDVFNIDRY